MFEQIDAYSVRNQAETKPQYRRSLLRLLVDLRPHLAELLGGPRECESEARRTSPAPLTTFHSRVSERCGAHDSSHRPPIPIPNLIHALQSPASVSTVIVIAALAANQPHVERRFCANRDDLIVWSSMLDNRYTVNATRTAPYRGELTIADDNDVLHREAVLLSFDSLFGPDVADVASCQEAAMSFADKLQQSYIRARHAPSNPHCGIQVRRSRPHPI